MKPCSPIHLPLKNLDWNRIAEYVGNAREAVARLDDEFKSNEYLVDLFLWDEAISSLQSQTKRLNLKTVFLNRIALSADKTDLQKIVYTKEAIDEALSQMKTMRLGKRFFCRIQAKIKQDCPRREDIGRFRKRQNWIGVRGCKKEEAYFFPPPPLHIDELWRNLEKYLAMRQPDPLVQIAIGFAQFLIIHPFMDGNGRSARIFIPLYSMKKGLTAYPVLLLSAYFETYRKDYFQKLYQLTETGDWEDWITFFLNGVICRATRIKSQAALLKKLFRKIEALAGPAWAEKLFRSPIFRCKKSKPIDLMLKEKLLTLQSENLYIFSPLFRAMRSR